MPLISAKLKDFLPAKLPLVSCLMVTQAKRDHMIDQALDCFYSQTYLPRELIVVADFPSAILNKNPADNVLVSKHPKGLKLGGLRNETLKLAKGEYIATWDDDDFYHKTRLEKQMHTILKEKSDACILNKIQLQCQCGFTTVSWSRPWECTLVAKKSSILEYEDVERGEDTIMMEKMLQNKCKISYIENDAILYEKRFHGDNVWGMKYEADNFLRSPGKHNCCLLRGESETSSSV